MSRLKLRTLDRFMLFMGAFVRFFSQLKRHLKEHDSVTHREMLSPLQDREASPTDISTRPGTLKTLLNLLF